MREQFGRYAVDIPNPEKVLFPESGYTKWDVVEYYKTVADVILPHLEDRPLTLRRFPDGIGKDGFYQKHASDHFPDWIARVTVPAEGPDVTHVMAQNRATLAYLAGQAAIDLHPWLSRRSRLHQPDQIVFDLDPSGDDFEPVRNAAFALRDLLLELDLHPLLKTTGSRGLHVVVPLRRGPDFDQVRAFARDIAGQLAAGHPDTLTTEVRKDKRRGRVFVDILRNAYAQTAVAPYSVRPQQEAPVATPLHWRELRDPALHSRSYHIRNIPQRLARMGDPWKGAGRHAVRFDAARERLDALIAARG